MLNIRAATITLVLTFLMAACGGGSSGSSPASPPPTGSSKNVSGTAQKGPFVVGSTVLVNRLASNGDSTSITLATQTIDSLGNFQFQMDPGPVEITVEGFHYNEILGRLAESRLTLRAIYEITSAESQQAHVNLLTHLTYLRIKRLVAQGASFASAAQQAEADLVGVLSPAFGSPALPPFGGFSVYASDSTTAAGSGYLLAVAASFYEFALARSRDSGASFDAELALILNNFGDDFADGHISKQWLTDGVVEASRRVDPSALILNLEDYASQLGFEMAAGDAALFIDTDGDGVPNAEDNDDDGDGVPDDNDPWPLNPGPSVSGSINGVAIVGHMYSEWLTVTSPDDDILSASVDYPDIIQVVMQSPADTNPPPWAPAQNGNWLLELQVSSGQANWPRLADVGTYDFRISLTDGSATVFVEDTLRILRSSDVPTLATHPRKNAHRGERYEHQLMGTSPSGVPLTWSIVQGPAWLAIDPTSGLLSGTVPTDYKTDLPQLPYYTSEEQAGYCRANLIGSPQYCAYDAVRIGISDGAITTHWDFLVDIRDPIVDWVGTTVHGGPGQEVLTVLLVDSNGNAIFGGATDGEINRHPVRGGMDAWLKKVDSTGSDLWARAYGTTVDDELIDAAVDQNGIIYALIRTQGDWSTGGAGTTPQPSTVLLGISAQGELSWTRILVTEIDAKPLSIDLSGGAEVKVLLDTDQGAQIWTVDAGSGDTISLATLSAPAPPVTLAVSQDGSTYVGAEDALVKVLSDGSLGWTHRPGNLPYRLTPMCIREDVAGYLVVVGSATTEFGNDVFVSKLASSGEVIWSRLIREDPPHTWEQGLGSNQVAPNHCVVVGAENSYFVSGYLGNEFNVPGDPRVLPTLVKVSPDGQVLWRSGLNTTDQPFAFPLVAKMAQGDLLLVGKSSTILPRVRGEILLWDNRHPYLWDWSVPSEPDSVGVYLAKFSPTGLEQ